MSLGCNNSKINPTGICSWQKSLQDPSRAAEIGGYLLSCTERVFEAGIFFGVVRGNLCT